jgi:alpha-tubulin suppressor-like RCC1 family protein
MTEAGLPFSGAVAIATGLGHRLALHQDGTVWAWGNNAFGQLGDGTTTNRGYPVRVAGLSDVITIGAAFNHSLALSRDGTVWSWGENHRGQVGDGTLDSRAVPVAMKLPLPAKAIAAGWTSGLAVLEDGTVWGWGDNFWGQLGDGTRTARASPVQAAGLGGIAAVSLGDFHMLALDSDGGVWALGENMYGQLGDGTTQERTQPARVLTASEEPLSATAVTAGAYFSLARTRDGTVSAWGGLGSGPFSSRTGPAGAESKVAVPVAGVQGSVALVAGMKHALAVQADGTVLAWGDNRAGQLGDGTTIPRDEPTLVMVSTGEPLRGITAVSAYRDGSLALRSDGTVWAWGDGAGALTQ